MCGYKKAKQRPKKINFPAKNVHKPMAIILSGIQQIGLGVANAQEAFSWYKKYFGFDIIIFKDEATASLMQQYTGHTAYQRKAILAINLQGGAGIEFWQYTNRTPLPPAFTLQLGDLGLFAIKIKCKNVHQAYKYFCNENLHILNTPTLNTCNQYHFFLKDLYGNVIEVIEETVFFTTTETFTAGICGVLIGVTDIEKSIDFYKNILQYDEITYQETGVFTNWQNIPGHKNTCTRALLKRSKTGEGAFANLLGPSQVELIQVMDRLPQKIYKNRYWGDLGYIHLCYDIHGMALHENICANQLYPLTVNSQHSFDMGQAAGQFAYNEDPDGTLIEYVETHKLPLLKKVGLYLNLKKRNPTMPLPNWIIQCFRLCRVK